MKKRYLSLFLAAVLSLGQIAGTVQPAQASGITEETGQLEQQEEDTPAEEAGQKEPEGQAALPENQVDNEETGQEGQTGQTQAEENVQIGLDGQTGPSQPEENGEMEPESPANTKQAEENGQEEQESQAGQDKLEENEGNQPENQPNMEGPEENQQEEINQLDGNGQAESGQPAGNEEAKPKKRQEGQLPAEEQEGQEESAQELFMQPVQPEGPEQAGQENQVQGQAESGYQPYLYSFYQDEIHLFPSQTTSIMREGGGVWRKDGAEDVPLIITDVKVQSGSEELISAEPFQWEEGGSGWRLSPKKQGKAEVMLTCGTDGTVTSGDATSIQPVEKKISIIISEKRYRIQGIATDTGTNNVLPGASVTLKADVYVDTDDDYGQKADDVDVIWKAEVESTGLNLQEKTLKPEEGFQVQVPEDGEDWYSIKVTAQVKDGDGIAASAENYLYVTNEYYVLDLNASEGIEELWIGQEGTIEPVLYHYVKGKKEPEIVKTAQYQFSYEEGDFEIRKGSKLIEGSALQDGGVFTLKRLKNTYHGINIAISLDGNVILYQQISFQQKNYGDSSIEGGTNKYETYIYVDDENPEENTVSPAFTVNTEKLAGEYQVAWELLVGQTAVPDDKKIYQVSGEKSETITITDVKALQEAFKAAQESAGEEEYVECRIRAIISAGGEEQTSLSKSIYFRTPYYELDDDDWEVIEGSALTYKDKKIAVYAENKDYPDGNSITLAIKDIQVAQQSPDFETASSNVFTVKQEGNDIKVIAENCGTATLEYTVILPYGGEKKFTLEKTVVQHIYQCNVWTSTGNSYLLPNEELKLESEVWHKYYDAALKDAVWEKLDAGEYTVSYQSRSEEIVSVTQDGTVKAKGQSGTETSIDVTWKIPQGKEVLERSSSIWIMIEDSYTQVSAKPLTVAPGETVEKIACEWKKFDLEHKDGVAEVGDITYQLNSTDRNIKINEARTGFTVAPDAQDGKKISIWISAIKTNKNGMESRANGTFFLNICQHNFTQKSIIPATCTKAGSRTLECSKCHTVTKTETVPATGHKAGNWATTKAATCTAAGTQTQKCTSCGTVVGTKEIPAAGHSFGAWKQTKAPTALKKGIKTRTCSVCKAKETQETKKLKAIIKLNATSIPLQVKKSTTAVKVTAKSKGDSIKSWKSSKPKIASVTSKGKITGKKVGTAKIKVTLKSNISATVTVKVQKKAVTTKKLAVTGKSIKKNKLTLKRKKSVTLKVTRTPVTSTEKITYKSSNNKIATVSKKGKITAKKAGKAKITVKSGKKKVTIHVTVKK